MRKLIKLCKEHNYVLFNVADHCNGEENEALDGSRVIDHIVNNIPFMTTLEGVKVKRQTLGKVPYIGNVAANQ
jgi:bisphosphoglycerate-independent phosphoglycerate mutase (AlkP superfamily)